MPTDPQAPVIGTERWWGRGGAVRTAGSRSHAGTSRPSIDARERSLESIQYLRAVSAVMVIIFHAAIQSSLMSGVYFPHVGKFGVDIFFVISGFVMWKSATVREISPIRFIKKRICRIVPLYWLFTLSVAAISLAKPGLLRSTSFDIPHLIASLAFVPWVNPGSDAGSFLERLTPVINPGWTLNFEMLFYAMFASALFLPRVIRIPALTVEMIAWHYLAASISEFASPARFYTQGVMFEFLFGIGIAAILPDRGTSSRFLMVGAIALAIAALMWGDLAQPVESRCLWLGIPAAILVASCVGLENAGWIPRIDGLGRIGGASYSIYLSHVIVIAAARTAIHLSGKTDGLMHPLIFIPLGVVASVVVGMLVHIWLEKPLTAWCARILRVA